jgi:histidinol-phosphate/aromatic aminotransferase/cobyric acid decarboxylase-like protein
MDRASIDDTDEAAHMGTDDHGVVDFGAGVNAVQPPGVASVYESSLSTAKRLPLDDYAEFRTAAADVAGCAPRQVVPAAGVFGALRQALEASVDPGDTVLVPEPGCGEYAREVRLQGATPEFVPSAEILDADPAGHAAVVVDNPTDPASRLRDVVAVQSYAERCREAGTLLVVDEAFLGFVAGTSVAGTPGLAAIQSVTNVHGLPGLRAGFVAATGETRERIETARLTYNLSSPAVAVATYCLEQSAFRERTAERVRTERSRLVERLEGVGFDVVPGDGPLVCFDAGPVGVDAVLEATRARDIAVRDARTYRGLDDHVRVTLRRPAENDRLLAALRAAVGDAPAADD